MVAVMMLTEAKRTGGPKTVEHDTRSCTCHDYGSGQGQRVRRAMRRRERADWRREVREVVSRAEWRS